MKWSRVEELFHHASGLDEQERNGFLNTACGDDAGLRREVLSLLETDELVGEFLEHPAMDVAARQIAAGLGNALVGRTVADYRVDRFVEAGGMASVYEAHDLKSGRRLALKVLFAEPELSADIPRIRRFLREAKVLGRLGHPNIPQVYGAGLDNELLYLAMEFVEGMPVSEVLKRGPLQEEQILDIAAQVASALSAAHARGVLHRDIKPSNLILTGGGTVKLIDFGLAKKIAPDGSEQSLSLSDTSLTLTGITMGTLDYMSPEQISGRDLDARSDLYSLGVTLFELTTGKPPSICEHLGEKIHQILEKPAPTARLLRPAISNRLEELIGTCLQKNPEERYQSAREVLDFIEGFSGSPRDSWKILLEWRIWLLVLALLAVLLLWPLL